MADATPERTAVYRLYDSDGELLYIGITNDLDIRFNDHRLKKSWWEQARRAEVAWHDSRKAAELAEFRAIQSEKLRIQ